VGQFCLNFAAEIARGHLVGQHIPKLRFADWLFQIKQMKDICRANVTLRIVDKSSEQRQKPRTSQFSTNAGLLSLC